MVKKSSEIFEDLLVALENMIDAQDDMWQEEKYHNHKQMWKISEERLIPAKIEFKKNLDAYLDRRFETFCEKNGIRRIIFSGKTDD